MTRADEIEAQIEGYRGQSPVAVARDLWARMKARPWGMKTTPYLLECHATQWTPDGDPAGDVGRELVALWRSEQPAPAHQPAPLLIAQREQLTFQF